MSVKSTLLLLLQQKVIKKINTTKTELNLVTDALYNETKCSVGDKHETGRAMMQIEHGKAKEQHFKALDFQTKLSLINLTKKYTSVELGALVTTNKGNYFLSIGFGKLILDDTTFYAISPLSPIGQHLLSQKEGAVIPFLQSELKIEKIE